MPSKMAAPMSTRNETRSIRVNFPYCDQPDVERQIFSDCGSIGHLTGDSYDTLFPQRLCKPERQWAKANPVLPIYFEEGNSANKDIILEELKESNMKLKSFAANLLAITKSTYYSKKTQGLSALGDMLEEYERTGKINLGQVNDIVISTELESHIKEYRTLSLDQQRLINNFKFTNGCIAFLPDANCSGYMMTPAGSDFSEIQLSYIRGDKDHVMHTNSVSRLKLPCTINGISQQSVQDIDYICVKTDPKCYIYKVNREKGIDEKLVSQFDITLPARQSFLSVNISPYIPNEYCLASNSGSVFMWSDGHRENIVQQKDFGTDNKWCYTHFGSHPRSLVYMDNTVVKLYDLRCTNVSPSNLFSLENLCIDGKDQFRVCQNSPISTFYHMLATDYSFVLLDERFPNTPVLKQDHMLQTMPQYISSISTQGENIVYLGSQFQPVVHRLTFKSSEDLPSQWMGLPFQIDRRSEFNSVPSKERSNYGQLFDQRLKEISLAGIKTVPFDGGHMVLQLDGLGEVFYQCFLERSDNDDDGNTVPSGGGGSDRSKTKPAAVKVANAWLAGWEERFMSSGRTQETESRKDVTQIFSSLVNGLPGFMACPLCMSVVSKAVNMEDYRHIRCPSCNDVVSDNHVLKEIASHDRILPVEDATIPNKLPQIPEKDSVSPNWSTVSHLLLEQFRGNTSMEDSLDHADNEKQGNG